MPVPRRLVGLRGDARAAVHVLRAARDPNLAFGCFAQRRLSRRAFRGWATAHEPRRWEYPWVVQQVRQRLRDRTPRAVDYGAGTSPVPIALTKLGIETTVVDPDAINLLGRRWGNEWDLADYRAWGVKTISAGIEDCVLEEASLGFAVSVSVIEHLPADVRRRGLAEVHRALEDHGVAVLTVDVIVGTRTLWNRVVEELEPTDVHGSVDNLLAEAERCGFQIEHTERSPIGTDELEVEALVLRKT